MEAAIRWSPLSTDDQKRFLLVDVAGNALTLYGAARLKQHDFQYSPIARRDRVPNFTAFDWSKSDDSLVALGLSSGNASLVRIDSGTSQYVALQSFPIKTQRKCNTIAFNTQNLLATGLDRVRHDHCLTVYDINDAETHSRLCVSEAVTSIRFFPSQPQELLAAVSRQTIRLYDLRDPTTSTAGLGNCGVTKLVNNIAIDPLDENYFASGGSTGDPSVTVWDRRWLARTTGSTSSIDGASNSAVLDLRPATDNSQTTSVWSIRYSGLKRGRFCLLSSAGEVKLYDTAHHKMQSKSRTPAVNFYGGNPWGSPHYIAKTHNLRYPSGDPQRNQDEGTRIIAFDWCLTSRADGQAMLALRPDRTVHVMHAPHPSHLSLTARDELALCQDEVLVLEPSATPKATIEDLTPPNRLGLNVHPDGDQLPEALVPQPKALDQQSLKALNGTTSTAAARTEKWLDDEVGKPPELIRNAKFGDSLAAFSIHRRRCHEGYLFNPEKNVEIVREDPALVKLWTIIARLESFAKDDGMVSKSLDLSYLGIDALWNGSLGKSLNRMVSDRSFMPATFDEAARGILETSGLPHFKNVQTEKPEHRQLCLAVCGWAFSGEGSREMCEQLLKQQNYYKAVATAMFHGHKLLALELLRDLIRKKIIQNIGLGALIASDTLNAEQREMCRWMEEDATDPYLRAILVYLSNGEWCDLVNRIDLELDLSDRLGIALRHLDDTQISLFISQVTVSCIATGNVEGVLLTGLTAQSMDLFQSYIRRTNDLQTAVLATAFTTPLYVDDVRWDMWKETYFQQLQSWRAFIERTKFTMQHTRRSITRSGTKLVNPPPRQLSLRCAHCQGSLARNTDGSLTTHKVGPVASGGSDTTRTRITGSAASAGTGVPGDFNLQLLDHIYDVPELRWVGNANELNGAYAADGYGRVMNRPGCVVTTHGVGELSALNGIAGAMTEQVKVIHVVGQTTRGMQKNHRMIHHSIGFNPDHSIFNKASKSFRAAEAELHDKESAPAEIDRAIRECFIQSRPVYIFFPLDMVDEKVPASLLDKPIDLSLPEDAASKKATEEATQAVIEAVTKAKHPVIFVDCLIQRHDAIAELKQLVEKLGFPIYTTNMGKGIIDETHPNYVGIYNGAICAPGLAEEFEKNDLVLVFGSLPADTNSGSFSRKITKENSIDFNPDEVIVKGHTYSKVYYKTIFHMLSESIKPDTLPKVAIPTLPAVTLAGDHASKEVKQSWIWTRICEFLKPGDVVLGETGTAAYGIPDGTFPKDVNWITQTYYGSIGYATPAALGVELALQDRSKAAGGQRGRTVLVTGDGSLQLTIQELGTMIAYGARPVILLINNSGYTIERVIHGAKQKYNDITPWNYSHALRLFGMSDDEAKQCYFRAETKEELDAIFAKEEVKNPQKVMLVEIIMDAMDVHWRLMDAVALRGADVKQGMKDAGFIFQTPQIKK
ncbi:hypothetical protein MBLNU459_g3638t1 [Dothideomycetes sp. NU459]